MEPTRRWWSVGGTGVVLLVLGVLTQRPEPIVGAAVLGIWLGIGAAHTAYTIGMTDESLTVSQTVSPQSTIVDEQCALTVRLTRPSPLSVAISADISVPPGCTLESNPQLELDAGERERSHTVAITPDVVGAFEMDPVDIEYTSPWGLFTQTVRRGETPTLTVLPRTPRNIHIGQGGESQFGAFGGHTSDQLGHGITTRGLRAYQAGDPTEQIDWKATARLGETYIRETEAEIDRQVIAIFDHRGRMGRGHEGATMLDYAREACLGIVQGLADAGDTIGLWTIGEAGITTIIQPQTMQVEQIRAELVGLKPTADAHRTEQLSPATAQRYHTQLTADTSPYAETLRPYFAAVDQYVQRTRDDPLVDAVRQIRSQYGTQPLLLLFTCDRDPVTIRESVRLGVRNHGYVQVFLTPQVLYHPGGLADLGDAYSAYVSFEDFRQDLTRLPRVTAYEVAPGDRLEAVLSAANTQVMVG